MAESHSILIADDEEAFLRSAARLLSRDGYDCDCATHVDNAIEKLQTRCYELLIADINMPGNSELALIHEARRIAPGMPVILITGYPSLDSAINAIRLPVASYLTKPLDFDRLRDDVRQLAARSHNHRVISEVCGHLQKCVDDLREVDRGNPNRNDSSQNPPSLVSIVTIRLLASCLSELLRVAAATSLNEVPHCLCDLLDCPQKPFHRDALLEVVKVLKKTKNTFKSKDLAQLRVKIETILDSSRPVFRQA
jgi:ActR/RegA family two-component response regulator